MSLLALKASIGGAPTLGEHHRDLGGKSGGGSEFTAIMSAMAAEDPQSILRAAAAKGAAGAQDRASPSANTPKPQQSGSIDAGLAALVYSALAGETAQSNARPAATKGAASAQDRASPSEDPLKSQQSGPIDPGTRRARLRRARRARRRDAQPIRSSRRQREERRAARRSRVELRRRQWVASRRRPVVARFGGTRHRREFRSGARRSRRCGACGGRRWAKDVSNGGERRPLSRPQRDTIAAPISGWTAPRKAKPGVRSGARRRAPPRKRRRRASPARRRPLRPTTPRRRRPGTRRRPKAVDFGPQRIAKRLGSRPVRRSAPAAVGPSASPALANPGVNPLATSIGPIACDQLPESLATQASALTSQTTTSSNSAPAASVGSAQVVKELRIELDPADLGAVSVKMRLVRRQAFGRDGGCDAEHSESHGERAWRDRRSAGLDRSAARNPDHQAERDEPDQRRERRCARSKTRKPGECAKRCEPGSQGNGQQLLSPRKRGGSANRQAMARPPAPRRGFGDLLV